MTEKWILLYIERCPFKVMKKLPEIAIQMEASARGWINYYGKFYPNNVKIALQALNQAIVRRAVRRYKRFKGSIKRAWQWLIKCYGKNRNCSIIGVEE